MIKYICIVTLTIFVAFALEAAEGTSSDKKPHIVLVCGPPHYSPNLSMAKMKTQLEELGFKATLVLGEGNVEKKTKDVLPGIEVIKDADLAIFFMRWLTLPDEEWQPIEDYLKSGKPVMGFRTANHGIKYPADHARFNWNDDFGRRVFATPYVVHQAGKTNVSILAEAKSHPILSHIDDTDWVSPGTLYLARLEPRVEPLLIGTGKGGLRVLDKDYGVEVANVEEADAVAWTWKNEWGGKTFFTSLGHLGDFKHSSFNRLWINAVHWTLDISIPSADLEIPSWEIKAKGKH